MPIHSDFDHDHELEARRVLRIKKRKALLALFGGKCVECGICDWRTLQIDHINGGGRQEISKATSTHKYYKTVKESVGQSEKKYQVLCANCNQIKRYKEVES